jgi:hypothetical protein
LNCFATDDGYAILSAQASSCASGLIFSQADNACCRTASNGVCNPYCAFSDNDCQQDPQTTIGNCQWTDNSQDDCEDGILERNLTATWLSESQKPASCKNIVDRLVCPAQIKVDFFGTLQFVIAVILIVLIYFIIKSRLKENQKRRSFKKKVVRKKGSRTKSLNSSSKNRERKSSKKRK